MSNDGYRHIISISGGKDSAALAIYLMQHRDIPNPEYVFMDTEQELPETYEFLDKLEGVLGREITRLTPRLGFEQLLKLHNGFLPSSQARWCTVHMKIVPFEIFVGDDHAYSYIGIRADEDRAGFISKRSNIVPIYPFIEDGITKADVNRILDESGIGLPQYYNWRSRSGCYFCFFQQQIEWVGLAENHPELFEQAAEMEKGEGAAQQQYMWNKHIGPLHKMLRQKERIKKVHQERMRRRTRRVNGRLVDVFADIDPFDEADAFVEEMRATDHSEGCLVCHV